jgi:hypothetical protein
VLAVFLGLLGLLGVLHVTVTTPTKAEKTKASYPGLNNYQQSSLEDSEVNYSPKPKEANVWPDPLPQPTTSVKTMRYPVHVIDRPEPNRSAP